MEPGVAGECPLRRQWFGKVTLSTKEQASSPIIVYTKKDCKAVQRSLAGAGVPMIDPGHVIDAPGVSDRRRPTDRRIRLTGLGFSRQKA